MKRVEGTSGIRLIECVSPARNRWRIRWDVQEREDGSASYMEEGFHRETRSGHYKVRHYGLVQRPDRPGDTFRVCL